MRRCLGGSALVAMMLSSNLALAAGAEWIAVWMDDAGSSAEGSIDLTGGDFLTFAAQTESAAGAYDGDYDYYYDYDAPPNWTIWAGAIFLQRDNPGSQTLASNAGGGLLNAGDFNFGPNAGPDLNAIRHGEVVDVGFRYFHVNRMSAHRRIFPPGPIDLNLATLYNIDCPQLDAFYLTSIQSAEINLRKNLTPNLTALAGFRYLSLSDNQGLAFDVLGDSFGLFTLHTFGINRLYGAQAGVDANVWTAGRFQVQTALKGGVYGNSAKNQLLLRTLGVLDSSIGTSRQQTSFVGDWNFTGVVQLTDIWAIRGGYQLLWVSGVALASEQFPLSDLLTPGIQIDTTGTLFLHGALVSLQAGW